MKAPENLFFPAANLVNIHSFVFKCNSRKTYFSEQTKIYWSAFDFELISICLWYYSRLEKMQSDFPNYYVSANLIANGKTVDSLYHADWFSKSDLFTWNIWAGKNFLHSAPTAFDSHSYCGWRPYGEVHLVSIQYFVASANSFAASPDIRFVNFRQPHPVAFHVESDWWIILCSGRCICCFSLYCWAYFFTRGNAGSTGIIIGWRNRGKIFSTLFAPTLIAEKDGRVSQITAVMIVLIHSVCMGIMGLQWYIRSIFWMFYSSI